MFNLPPGFSGSCIPDTADTDGELDCFIFLAGFPLQALPDSTLATVKLKTASPAFAVDAAVNFSTSSPAFSFGSTQGLSIPGTATNGVVQISGLPVPDEADLMLVKTDNPDPVFASNVLTYTLSVTNNGPKASGSVVLTDTMPVGISFQQAIGSGWVCSLAANKLSCSRPGMAIGANASLGSRDVAAPQAAPAGLALLPSGRPTVRPSDRVFSLHDHPRSPCP